MDEDTLRALLAMSEGETLDFKERGYPAGDAGNAELAKDIMAMANRLGHGERGRILLGVREASDGTGEVIGLSDSVDDARLQEAVKHRITPAPTFLYSEVITEEGRCGIVEIAGVGKRPYFALRDAGVLRRNTALVRRGSSTDVASPVEIIEWHNADNPRAARVRDLELEKLEADRRPTIVITPRHRSTTAAESEIIMQIRNVGTCSVVVEQADFVIQHADANRGEETRNQLPGGPLVMGANGEASLPLKVPVRRLSSILLLRVRSVPYDVVEEREVSV